MQDILVIVDIGNHPMSPSNEEIGAFLLIPRNLLIKLFWIFVIIAYVLKPQMKHIYTYEWYGRTVYSLTI